jgi:hypothetical protein
LSRAPVSPVIGSVIIDSLVFAIETVHPFYIEVLHFAQDYSPSHC